MNKVIQVFVAQKFMITTYVLRVTLSVNCVAKLDIGVDHHAGLYKFGQEVVAHWATSKVELVVGNKTGGPVPYLN